MEWRVCAGLQVLCASARVRAERDGLRAWHASVRPAVCSHDSCSFAMLIGRTRVDRLDQHPKT